MKEWAAFSGIRRPALRIVPDEPDQVLRLSRFRVDVLPSISAPTGRQQSHRGV